MISDILVMTTVQFPKEIEDEFLVGRMREIRDAELKATDFWGLSDFTMTAAQIQYRQDLRDLPNIFTPAIDGNGQLVMTDFPTYAP
jgi:hypothetical protein